MIRITAMKAPMSFEAGPANPQPFSASMHLTPSFDVIETLPVGAADRLRALRQHVADKHAVIPPFADIHDANTARGDAERQLQRLLAHRAEGGFHLDPTDKRVIVAQELLAKLTADAQRLKELDEVRAAAWRTTSETLVAVEQWLRDGRPAGTVLEDIDGPPEVKLIKGESVTDAIERLRRRSRELKADLHRIRSAPYPSSHAKARMRAQIDALAQQGAPNVSDLVENDRQIVWPVTNLQSRIYNTEVPSLGFAETHDMLPLIAWLHRDALIAALDREITTESDDKAALSHDARQQRETVVLGDLLAVERDESALVWKAMDEGLPVEHRADCAPQAILQCMIVIAPRVTASGTSREHGIDMVDHSGRRRR
jgi:hypothetical protein